MIRILRTQIPKHLNSQLSESNLFSIEEKVKCARILELTQDLKILSESLQKAPRKGKETVLYTIDCRDVFVTRSQVGSSQRLDTSPNLNKCLPTYSLDAKNGGLNGDKQWAKRLDYKFSELDSSDSGIKLTPFESFSSYEYVDAAGVLKKKGQFSMSSKKIR